MSIRGGTHVNALQSTGVLVRMSDDRDFGSHLRTLLGDRADAASRLEPYLVLVENHSMLPIIAYTVQLSMTHKGQAPDIHNLVVKFPDTVAGEVGANSFPRGSEIWPGEQRAYGFECEIDPSGSGDDWINEYAEWQKANTKDVVSFAAVIDAALFSDGTIAGNNTSDLGERFLSHLEAQQKQYREIVDGLDRGESLDEAYKGAVALLTQGKGNRRPRPTQESVYKNLSAGEAQRWRAYWGDDKVGDILRQALRKEPFIIRPLQ